MEAPHVWNALVCDGLHGAIQTPLSHNCSLAPAQTNGAGTVRPKLFS